MVLTVLMIFVNIFIIYIIKENKIKYIYNIKKNKQNDR